MIELDYSHKALYECKAIWTEIIQNMLQEDFYIENNLFLITTDLKRDEVCNKARRALILLDDYLETHKQHLFQYITDFFIIDMSDYINSELQLSNIGVVLKE